MKKGDKGDTGPQGPQGEKGAGVGKEVANGGEIFNDYDFNVASGLYSHAEGQNTQALGENSHASGYRTVAGYKNQFVCGQNNANKENTLFEVGNGDNDLIGNSNAFEVYRDGHTEIYGYAEIHETSESDYAIMPKLEVLTEINKRIKEELGDLEALLGGI